MFNLSIFKKLSQAFEKGLCYNEFLLPRIFRQCAISINGGGKRKMRMQMCKGSLLTHFLFSCGSVCDRLHLLSCVNLTLATDLTKQQFRFSQQFQKLLFHHGKYFPGVLKIRLFPVLLLLLFLLRTFTSQYHKCY